MLAIKCIELIGGELSLPVCTEHLDILPCLLFHFGLLVLELLESLWLFSQTIHPGHSTEIVHKEK